MGILLTKPLNLTFAGLELKSLNFYLISLFFIFCLLKNINSVLENKCVAMALRYGVLFLMWSREKILNQILVDKGWIYVS